MLSTTKAPKEQSAPKATAVQIELLEDLKAFPPSLYKRTSENKMKGPVGGGGIK